MALSGNGESGPREEWLRIGVGLLVLQYVVLAAVLLLLRIDVLVALITAGALSILFGIGITVYVLYVRNP